MGKIDFTRMIPRTAHAAEKGRLTREADLAQAMADLAATDWLVIRAAEGGAAMAPKDRAARAKARDTISRLRAELAALRAELAAVPPLG